MQATIGIVCDAGGRGLLVYIRAGKRLWFVEVLFFLDNGARMPLEDEHMSKMLSTIGIVRKAGGRVYWYM